VGVKRRLVPCAVAFAALLATQAADANRLHANAADQAKARRVVLKRTDLPAISGGWKSETPTAAAGPGGSSPAAGCAGYSPKTSDLVTTGSARSEFSVPGLDIRNDVTLLSSERMVQVDWSRTMTAALVPCLGRSFAAGAGGKVKVISVRKLAFPALAPHTAAYRLLFGMTIKGKPILGLTDFVALSGGRAELTFVVVAAVGPPSEQKAAESTMNAIDQRLAGPVAARVFAPTA
jgi:hypothetical protein